MTDDIVSTLAPAMDEGVLNTLDLGQHADYGVLNMYAKTLENVEQSLERLLVIGE